MIRNNIIRIIIAGALLFVFLFISCSRNDDNETFIRNITEKVTIDLSKINTEPYEITEPDLTLKEYRNKPEQLQKDIDSLLALYPDSYDLKALKIHFLQNRPEYAERFVVEMYRSDSLNSHHQFFYGTRLSGDEGKEYFSNMIRKKRNDPYGYLGLALAYLYEDASNLEMPAKLSYLSIIKDHTVKDAYEVLSYIYSSLGKYNDLAALNGIMLVKDPSNIGAFENLMYYYFSEGLFKNSRDLLDVFVKNNPGVLSNSAIAENYAFAGYLEDAEKYVRLARESGEKESVLDLIEAKLNVSSGETEEGFKLLKRFADANSTDRNLIHSLTDPVFAGAFYTEKEYRDLLKRFERGAPTIGDKLPKISGMFFDGTSYSPDSVEGSVHLVDFWAEWCDPCRREMPAVLSVYEEYGSKEFKVTGINLDKEDDREKALKFIDENQIIWQNIFSGNGWDDPNVSKFNIVGIPATFLVDRKGVIRYKNLRGRDILASKVRKLLSE